VGQARLEAYLSTHDVPLATELAALGSKPEQSLMTIAKDSKILGLTRARAVAALRLLPSPSVQDFLGKLLESMATAKDPMDRLILRRAAVALGWLGGAHAPEQLALLFGNEDPEVRLDAAIGLGLTRSAAAARPLQNQLAVETISRVKEQIERQLQALREANLLPQEKSINAKKAPPMRSDW
jgi:HEAT repeat protein